MLKIALCVKQVPDTDDIKWTENNTLQRDGVESILNPYDVYATEFALNIKKMLKDVEITVFSMGPIQAENMLRKLLALGCDSAVLISDKKFAGADTYATGYTISQAIMKAVADYDLIICGQFAVDGDTAQTGPCIANFLDIAQITFVKSLYEVDNDSITVIREVDEGEERVKANFPVLICKLQDDFEPSRAKINDIKFAADKPITVYTMENLMIDSQRVGLKGSPTYVSKAFRNIINHNAHKYELSVEESVKLLDEQIKLSASCKN